jgi:hypothetical protein
MTIYEFVYDNTDWVAGPNKRTIVEWYMNHTGLGIGDLMEMDIRKLPKEEWKENQIRDFNGSEDENGEYPVIHTFESYLEQMEPHTVEIIASTNY